MTRLWVIGASAALLASALAAPAEAGTLRHSADLNRDGTVDHGDIAAFRVAFNTGDMIADLDGDGRVDFADAALLKGMLGTDSIHLATRGGVPRVSLLPGNNGPLQPEDQLVLEVWFDGVADPILGGGFIVDFDPTLLGVVDFTYTLVDVSGLPCDEPTSQCILLDPPVIDSVDGSIEAGAGDFAGIGILGEPVKVAEITFESLALANSLIRVTEGGTAGSFVCIGDFATCPGLLFENATLSTDGAGFGVPIVTPTFIDFGNVTSEETASAEVSVQNIGSAALQIGTVAMANPLVPEFAILDDTCSGSSLAVNDACTLTVSFMPVASGTFDDSFDVPSDSPLSPSINVDITGTGNFVVPEILADADLDFPAIIPGGTTSTASLVVFNVGTGTLEIGTIGGSDPLEAPFSNDQGCGNISLAPSAACTITVTFAPDDAGVFTDTFDIPSNDPNMPNLTITVTAQSEPPVGQIDLSTTSLEFGELLVGDSASLVVTATNVGGGPADLGGVGDVNELSAPYAFGADSCSDISLAPGASCQVEVVFTPQTSGSFFDQFSFPLDDGAIVFLSVSGDARRIGMSIPFGVANLGICKNADTGQRIAGPATDGVIDCGVLGLDAAVAEQVNIFAPVVAVTDNVLALVDGLDPAGLIAICTNRTTGDSVTFQPGSGVVNCLNGGLAITAGDSLLIIVRGPAL